MVNGQTRPTGPTRPTIPTEELTKRTLPIGDDAAGALRWTVENRIETLRLMREDPQIALGLALIKAPICGAEWRVESNDNSVADFIAGELRRIWRSALRSSLAAVEFGFSPHEKIWTVDADGAHIKSLKDLDPAYCVLLRDADGQFAGIRWNNEVTVPAEKSFVFTHGKEFGGLYGRSRCKPAAQYWRWGNNVYKLMNTYLQRRAIPALKGRAPAELRHTPSGTLIDTMDEMQKNMAAFRSGGAVVLPADLDEQGKPLWDAELMLDSQQRSLDFLKPIEHYETMKLRGMIIPERVATQGAAGTYAMAEMHTRTFLVLEDQLLFDILDHCNQFLIPQLVLFNFGPDADSAQVVSKGIGDEAKALLRALLEKILTQPITAPLAAEILDVTAVLEGAGAPVLAEGKTNALPAPVGQPPPAVSPAGMRLLDLARRADERVRLVDHATADGIVWFDQLIADVKKN